MEVCVGGDDSFWLNLDLLDFFLQFREECTHKSWNLTSFENASTWWSHLLQSGSLTSKNILPAHCLEIWKWPHLSNTLWRGASRSRQNVVTLWGYPEDLIICCTEELLTACATQQWIRVFHADFSHNDGSGFSMLVFHTTMDQGFPCWFFTQRWIRVFHASFSHNNGSGFSMVDQGFLCWFFT